MRRAGQACRGRGAGWNDGLQRDGLRFTTPETVAIGTSEVRLALGRPTETGAIVVREVAGAKRTNYRFGNRLV